MRRAATITVNQVIEKSLKWATGLLLALMAVTVFVGVVFRYAFRSPLSFPEELSKLAFTWVVFLGAALVAAKREHIAIETLVEVFPARVRAAISAVIHLLTVGFMGVVAAVGSQYAWSAVGDTSAAMEISMAWWAVPIPISAVLIMWYTLVDMRKHVLPTLLDAEVAEAADKARK